MRLVPALEVTFIPAEDTIAVSSAMYICLLLFTVYIISLAFIYSKPMAGLTVRLCGDMESFKNQNNLFASSNNHDPI